MKAKVYSKTLIEDYSTVAQFEFPSEAEIEQAEGIKFVGSNFASTSNKVSATDITVARGKTNIV